MKHLNSNAVAFVPGIYQPGHFARGFSRTLHFDPPTRQAGQLDEAEFQKKVLGGVEKLDTDVKAVATKAETILGDVQRLDKQAKDTLEDITKLKKTANDSASDATRLVQKISLLENQVRNQVRGAYGDPVKRIQNDEDLRLRFNAAVRLAVSNSDGDMRRFVRKSFPGEFVTKALGEDSSPGSTLINNALANEIYDTLAMYGVWNTFAVRRLGTMTTKFPVKTARVAAGYILTEGDPLPDDGNKAGTSVNANVEVIAARLDVSLQLLQDAEFDVTADILNDFGEAYAYVQDWSCLQADGTADGTDGGMTGIFGGGGTACVAAAGNVKVGQTDLEDWQNTLLGVDAIVLSRPARWWMHPQMLVRALGVKDAHGRSIFLTALEAPSPGAIGSILGYPITLAHAAPNTDAANAKVAVFGDPSAQVAGVRTDFTFEASDHARWSNLQRSFRGYGRFGNKIRKSSAFGVLTLPAA